MNFDSTDALFTSFHRSLHSIPLNTPFKMEPKNSKSGRGISIDFKVKVFREIKMCFSCKAVFCKQEYDPLVEVFLNN